LDIWGIAQPLNRADNLDQAAGDLVNHIALIRIALDWTENAKDAEVQNLKICVMCGAYVAITLRWVRTLSARRGSSMQRFQHRMSTIGADQHGEAAFKNVRGSQNINRIRSCATDGQQKLRELEAAQSSQVPTIEIISCVNLCDLNSIAAEDLAPISTLSFYKADGSRPFSIKYNLATFFKTELDLQNKGSRFHHIFKTFSEIRMASVHSHEKDTH
jgi:hypothetical protein